MVVVDDADVAVLSLVGTIDVDEIIGPEKKNKAMFIWIFTCMTMMEVLKHKCILISWEGSSQCVNFTKGC